MNGRTDVIEHARRCQKCIDADDMTFWIKHAMEDYME